MSWQIFMLLGIHVLLQMHKAGIPIWSMVFGIGSAPHRLAKF